MYGLGELVGGHVVEQDAVYAFDLKDDFQLFEGVDFYFESQQTRRRFLEMPGSYILPGYKMEPEPEPDAGEQESEASDL